MLVFWHQNRGAIRIVEDAIDMIAEDRKAGEELPPHDDASDTIAKVQAPGWQSKERWTKKALDRNSRCDDAFWAWAAPGQ